MQLNPAHDGRDGRRDGSGERVGGERVMGGREGVMRERYGERERGREKEKGVKERGREMGEGESEWEAGTEGWGERDRFCRVR
jgi:hypothetical protein